MQQSPFFLSSESTVYIGDFAFPKLFARSYYSIDDIDASCSHNAFVMVSTSGTLNPMVVIILPFTSFYTTSFYVLISIYTLVYFDVKQTTSLV